MTFWFTVLDHGNVVFFAVRSNSQEDVTETPSMWVALLAPPDVWE
jgi:hypothetical protein